MATMPNEDNNQPLTGEAHRNKVIATLPLSKQFSIRQYLSNCDGLSRDQAVDLLKDMIVQSAQKDAVFAELLKSEV